MTKLYSLETLFLGTAVVYAPAQVDQFAPHSDRSVEHILAILLILLMLVHHSCFMTID
jgi:hypothetical protein